MNKLIAIAALVVIGGLSVGNAAPPPTGTVDLTLNAQDDCVIGTANGTLGPSNYTWSDATDLVLPTTISNVAECNQNAPSPTGTATGTASTNIGSDFMASDGNGHFLDYSISQGAVNSQTLGSGNGLLATPDVYQFDLEVTVNKNQPVPAGTYSDTINIDITG